MVKIAMTGTHLLLVRRQQHTSCLSIREALLLVVLLLLSINKVIVAVDAGESSEDAAGGGGGVGGLGGKEMIKPYSLDTSMTEDWAGLRMQRHRCVDIPSNLTLCQNVGYKQMRLPNFFAHDNIPEVGQQSAIWISLIGRKCHPDTKLFLCSLFTPICLEQVINPCNSLCTAVKQSCESIMLQWGYPWPKILGCDQFPLDHDLCIHPQHTIPEDNICQPCKEPDTFEGLVDSFCRAGAVFRVTVDSVNAENGYLRVNFMRKKRAYKRGSLVKKQIRKLAGYIPVTNKCDCAKNNASLIAPKKRLLVMGRMEQDKFLLFFVSPYQRKSEGFRAATKMWKKDNPCKSWAIPDVYNRDKTEKKEKNKTDKKRNRNDKKNRKKKKRRRKKKGSKKRNKDRKKSKKGNEVSPPSQ